MTERLYFAAKLAKEEMFFQIYFEHLEAEFSYDKYEIWIKNTDFERSIGAGIVNRSFEPPVAATVWFKYGGLPVANPLSTEKINMIRESLKNGMECEFNKP